MKCDKCGELDHVLVHGYDFGDRLLEDVWFKVKDEGGHPKAMGVTPECQEYFDDLNTGKWLGACEAFCEHLDLATCPKCRGEVVVWGNPIVTGKTPPPAKAIPLVRGDSLIERMGGS